MGGPLAPGGGGPGTLLGPGPLGAIVDTGGGRFGGPPGGPVEPGGACGVDVGGPPVGGGTGGLD